MPFLTEPDPPRAVATEILPGIRRLVARNPSVMTYHGTNTFLIDDAAGLTVLDPGPADEAHVKHLLAAAGETKIARIIVTHGHSDHSGAAPQLRELTGAPVLAHRNFTGTAPDITLEDGDEVAGLTAVFTPGHAGDHLSFARATASGKILFSGDHVMSWSSSIVDPPRGDMTDYYRSLELLLGRDDGFYLPAHGPLLPDPRDLVAELLTHRRRREQAILARLRKERDDVRGVAAGLYYKTDPWLKTAAERNVLAHLIKLRDEGVVRELDPPEDLSAPDHGRDRERRFVLT